MEDDPATRDATCALLERWGCDVPLAANAPGPGLCSTRQCTAAGALDVHLGQHYGPDIYAQLCDRWGQQPPVILLTAGRQHLAPSGRRARLGLSGQARTPTGAAGADEPDLCAAEKNWSQNRIKPNTRKRLQLSKIKRRLAAITPRDRFLD
ncbi:hypothetical protein J4711_13855 [Staphylococcus epidermidis]|nr:hypothetical protein [Staphylococcus epidermidis]